MACENFFQRFPENHPERAGQIEALFEADKVRVPGSGYCIIDSNLATSEYIRIF